MRYARFFCTKVVNLLMGLLLGGVWGYFAYRQFTAFTATGQWNYLVFACTEVLIAAFFVSRSTPRSVSLNPLDWAVSLAGSFAPSMFTPAASGVLPPGVIITYIGMAVQILGLLSLNRSFAIVPALRSVKTAGLYRIVRHPLYAGHILAMSGYVLTNTSPLNLSVYAVTSACLVCRMFREEKILSLDKAYRDYMQVVRYRVLPYVF